MAREKGKKGEKPRPVQHGTPPSHEDQKRAAYYRWLERGAPAGGDGQEDWYEVENRWRDNIVPENND
jgi:hypothetical protein